MHHHHTTATMHHHTDSHITSITVTPTRIAYTTATSTGYVEFDSPSSCTAVVLLLKELADLDGKAFNTSILISRILWANNHKNFSSSITEISSSL